MDIYYIRIDTIFFLRVSVVNGASAAFVTVDGFVWSMASTCLLAFPWWSNLRLRSLSLAFSRSSSARRRSIRAMATAQNYAEASANTVVPMTMWNDPKPPMMVAPFRSLSTLCCFLFYLPFNDRLSLCYV